MIYYYTSPTPADYQDHKLLMPQDLPILAEKHIYAIRKAGGVITPLKHVELTEDMAWLAASDIYMAFWGIPSEGKKMFAHRKGHDTLRTISRMLRIKAGLTPPKNGGGLDAEVHRQVNSFMSVLRGETDRAKRMYHMILKGRDEGKVY